MQEHASAGIEGLAFLYQIIRNSTFPVVLTRARDGRILAVSAEWSQLSGYAHDDAVGHTTIELGFWFDEQLRSHNINEFLTRGCAYMAETQMPTADGRHVTASTHSSCIEVGDEQYVLVHVAKV